MVGLRHICNWAIGRDLLSATPFHRRGLRIVTKNERRRDRRISEAEEQQLLDACKRYRDNDDRVQIQEYDDLKYPQLTVHAFYVKYLLPIYFDVQCLERTTATAG